MKIGIKFINYDEQYQDCIVIRSSIKEAIDLADKMLKSIAKFSLMEELNKMQGEVLCNNKKQLTVADFEKTCFANKDEIPFYFINLILKDFGMCLTKIESEAQCGTI